MLQELALTLFLIQAHDLHYVSVGWSIRHLMILRENYLGTFTHFSTLHEYLEMRKKRRPAGDPLEDKYREGNVRIRSFMHGINVRSHTLQSNALHVELNVAVMNAFLAAPAGIPGYESRTRPVEGSIGPCFVMHVPRLDVLLRLHEYFMGACLSIQLNEQL